MRKSLGRYEAKAAWAYHPMPTLMVRSHHQRTFRNTLSEHYRVLFDLMFCMRVHVDLEQLSIMKNNEIATHVYFPNSEVLDPGITI